MDNFCDHVGIHWTTQYLEYLEDRDKIAEYKVLILPLLTKTQKSQLTAKQPLTKTTTTTKKKTWNILYIYIYIYIYPRQKIKNTVRW